MFYISPQLTVLMLAVVPPVSLGAVRVFATKDVLAFTYLALRRLGFLRSISEASFQQDTGSPR